MCLELIIDIISLFLILGIGLYDVEVGVTRLIWIAILLFWHSRIKAYSLVQIIFDLYVDTVVFSSQLITVMLRLVNGIYRVDEYIVALVVYEFYGHSLIKHWTRCSIFPHLIIFISSIFWRVAYQGFWILGVHMFVGIDAYIKWFELIVSNRLIHFDKLRLFLLLFHFWWLWFRSCRFVNNLFLVCNYWMSVRIVIWWAQLVIQNICELISSIERNGSSSDSGRVFERQCFVGTLFSVISVAVSPIYFLHHLIFLCFSFNYRSIALDKKTQATLLCLLKFLGLQLMQTRLVAAILTGQAVIRI